MTAIFGFPRDGHTYSSADVGRALAGLIQRDANGVPVAGMLATAPKLTAVNGAWRVEVGRFVYVHQVACAVQLSGLAVPVQVDIVPAAGDIPAGQARIDLICWNVDTAALVVAKGTPSASPVAPSNGGMARVGTVRVNAGDGQVVAERVANDSTLTQLAGSLGVAKGVVTARSVAAHGSVTVPVTFPVGMFDEPPIVLVSGFGGSRDTEVYVVSVTKDGCVIGLGSNSVVARTFGAMWRAERA